MTGGAVSGNRAIEDCGGIFTNDKSTLKLNKVIVSGNESIGQGGCLFIRSKDDRSEIKDCVITRNSAGPEIYKSLKHLMDTDKAYPWSGGGIYVDASSRTITLKNTTVDHNEALSYGGGSRKTSARC